MSQEFRQRQAKATGVGLVWPVVGPHSPRAQVPVGSGLSPRPTHPVGSAPQAGFPRSPLPSTGLCSPLCCPHRWWPCPQVPHSCFTPRQNQPSLPETPPQGGWEQGGQSSAAPACPRLSPETGLHPLGPALRGHGALTLRPCLDQTRCQGWSTAPCGGSSLSARRATGALVMPSPPTPPWHPTSHPTPSRQGPKTAFRTVNVLGFVGLIQCLPHILWGFFRFYFLIL